MVRSTHCEIIGTIGTAKATSFHPGEHIHNNYPNNYNIMCLNNATITRDGLEIVNQIDPLCYFVNIIGIERSLHIMIKMFQVDVR